MKYWASRDFHWWHNGEEIPWTFFLLKTKQKKLFFENFAEQTHMKHSRGPSEISNSERYENGKFAFNLSSSWIPETLRIHTGKETGDKTWKPSKMKILLGESSVKARFTKGSTFGQSEKRKKKEKRNLFLFSEFRRVKE